MTLTIPNIDEMIVSVNKEIQVQASLVDTFDALVEQIGADHPRRLTAPRCR